MNSELSSLHRVVLGIHPSGTVALVPHHLGSGSLKGVADQASLPSGVVAAFEESIAGGLTQLSSSQWSHGLTPVANYWRDFARTYFRALCRHRPSQTTTWSSPNTPGLDHWQQLMESAPPMSGLEYLRADSLSELWRQLDSFTAQKIAASGKHSSSKQHLPSLNAYLHQLDPAWNLSGRVTFHLAENKKNESRPFAFLATYTKDQYLGSSARGSGALQHTPLADALKQSIQNGDTAQLDVLLEPVSRAADNCDLVRELLETRNLFSPQAWTISRAFEFLSAVPEMESAGVIVRVPNWWNASRPPRPQVTVRVGNRATATLGAAEALDFKVDVSIDGESLSAAELQELMKAREGLSLLRGKWVQVDQQQLKSALDHWQTLQQQHAGGLGFLEGMRLLSGATLPGEADDRSIQPWTRIQPGPWLQDTLATLRSPAGKVALEQPGMLKATLRPYQLDGLRWLWFANQLGLGVCLADDMGLGKTIQIIALLLELKFPNGKKRTKRSAQKDSPSLLIVPTSLLGNWSREVERFSPNLRLFVAHRSVTDVAKLKRVAADPKNELAEYDLVMTTYGLARRDRWLQESNWRLVILDEAQAIKNASSSQTKTIKKIPAKNRIVMTGTPVENQLGDVWSLFDFCSPGLLGTAGEFKKFVKASEGSSPNGGLSALRRLIQPYVLRRLKTDPAIAPDLPAKTELRVDCGLTPAQAALYQQTLDDLETSLKIATGIQRRGMVLSVLMQLKQICNHPSLLLKRSTFGADDSGKFAELRTIVDTLETKQEKMLVFTQFQTMCEPLCDYLATLFGRGGLMLSGKSASAKRGKLVAEFQQESGPPFFVISVKAGGTGLNLTQACHVVHFDRWWNPAVEDQATDRAFRIGQQRNVMVHKFVCRGTLEERIDDLIHSKKQISEDLFGAEGEINLTEMSNSELMSFVALDLNKATSI